MARDIKQKLLNSDAAQSLEMERRVAAAFRAVGWAAQQSVYYTDVETHKLREVDVLAKNFVRGEGDSDLNLRYDFSVFCECKSLSEQHIVVTPTTGDGLASLHGVDYLWIGHDRSILQKVANTLDITSTRSLHALSKYIDARSHPKEVALHYGLRISEPAVDVISGAFRETNSSHTRDIESSVIWKTILGLFSATRAAKQQRTDVALEWICGSPDGVVLRHSKDHVQAVAFFLDDQLLQFSFYHPVIFTKAKIWLLDDGQLIPLKSVRLNLSNIDFSKNYVDLVSEAFVEEYVHATLRRFDREMNSGLKKVERRLDRLKWSTAQGHYDFEDILSHDRFEKNI